MGWGLWGLIESAIGIGIGVDGGCPTHRFKIKMKTSRLGNPSGWSEVHICIIIDHHDGVHSNLDQRWLKLSLWPCDHGHSKVPQGACLSLCVVLMLAHLATVFVVKRVWRSERPGWRHHGAPAWHHVCTALDICAPHLSFKVHVGHSRPRCLHVAVQTVTHVCAGTDGTCIDDPGPCEARGEPNPHRNLGHGRHHTACADSSGSANVLMTSTRLPSPPALRVSGRSTQVPSTPAQTWVTV